MLKTKHYKAQNSFKNDCIPHFSSVEPAQNNKVAIPSEGNTVSYTEYCFVHKQSFQAHLH